MAIPKEPTLSTRMNVLKRSEGRHACQFSAYIAGERVAADKVLNRNTGEHEPAVFDYRRRVGVELSELMTPEGVPAWAADRQTLWNRVEAKERRTDSQLARDFRFGFSYDLTASQRRDLAREVAAHFTAQGMCADVAVHRYSQAWAANDPKTIAQLAKWRDWKFPFVDAAHSAELNSEHIMETYDKDGKPKEYRWFQPHCHVMLTMRPLSPDGSGFEGKTEKLVNGQRVKSTAREWNDQKNFEALRGWICDRQNAELEAIGSDRRVDPRGYEVRRDAELKVAAVARAEGRLDDAANATERAAQLRRTGPYLGVVQKVTQHVRERFSTWVAVRHRRRMQPLLDALNDRDPVDFASKMHNLVRVARQTLGLELEPKGVGVER